MKKLKGCRSSEVVGTELTNLFASYGAAKHRLEFTLPEDIEKMKGRINELRLEYDEASKQEAEMKNEPAPAPLEAVQ